MIMQKPRLPRACEATTVGRVPFPETYKVDWPVLWSLSCHVEKARQLYLTETIGHTESRTGGI
jgi:hypothetical protein